MARTGIYKHEIVSFNGAKFNSSADLDVWLRMLSFGSFAIIVEPLIKYRLSSSSYSFNLKKLRVKKADYFSVVDYHMKNKGFDAHLNKKDFLNYEMQLLLDHFLISTNKKLKGSSVSLFGYRKSYNVKFLTLRFILKNPKFNFLVYAFFVLVCLTPKNKTLLSMLNNLRYGK
jgi:hypothetical protein